MIAYINSIYLATEGEGIHIGTPRIFVRFQGCTIGCKNCDTKESWAFEQAKTMSVEDVLSKVSALSDGKEEGREVSITGGDPLHPKNVPAVSALIKNLQARGFWVNLEASGVNFIRSIFDATDFISFDFKPPSTGVKCDAKHLFNLVESYPPRKFQIKSVIETEDDFIAALECYKELCRKMPKKEIPWCLTPCYNTTEDFPRERFQKVLQLNQRAGGPFRVIGQQHKWIYGAEAREV